MVYKNNTSINLEREKLCMCMPPLVLVPGAYSNSLFLMEPFESFHTHRPMDGIRNTSMNSPYQGWSLKEKPQSRGALLIWTSRGLEDVSLFQASANISKPQQNVMQLPGCSISEASFKHSKSHPGLCRHVLKTSETGSDLEMIFNQISYDMCDGQVTAGWAIKMHLSSVIFVGLSSGNYTLILP